MGHQKLPDWQTLKENPVFLGALVAAFLFVPVLNILLYYFNNRSIEKPFLDKNEFKSVRLVEKKIIGHSSRLFRFALPHPKTKLGLPIGQHITFRADLPEGALFRSYTPVSDDDQLGFVDFAIKVYPQGKMTQYLDNLKIGAGLLFKGPKGQYKYSPNSKRAIGMIAGGSGITPMYQVANAILKNKRDKTQVSLIYANVTEDSILLREELDMWARIYPNFKVFYVLNEAPEGWKGGVGFVTADMIREHCPPPAEDVLVLRCGPPPMNKAMAAHLAALGYAPAMQHEF